MTDKTQAETLRQEYRATMPADVLHLWAKDAIACIVELEARCAHIEADTLKIIEQRNELAAQLSAIGAGGVEALRKPAQAVAVPADALDSVRVLLRVAKNQISKASMKHAIGVVQVQLEKAAACIYAAAPAQEHATQLAGQEGAADAHAAWSAFEKLESDRGAAEPQSSVVRDYLMRAASIGIYRAAPAQAQEDARDAARYRYWKQWWVHEESETAQLPKTVDQMLEDLDIDAAFDAAIDAVRAAQGGA